MTIAISVMRLPLALPPVVSISTIAYSGAFIGQITLIPDYYCGDALLQIVSDKSHRYEALGHSGLIDVLYRPRTSENNLLNVRDGETTRPDAVTKYPVVIKPQPDVGLFYFDIVRTDDVIVLILQNNGVTTCGQV